MKKTYCLSLASDNTVRRWNADFFQASLNLSMLKEETLEVYETETVRYLFEKVAPYKGHCRNQAIIDYLKAERAEKTGEMTIRRD